MITALTVAQKNLQQQVAKEQAAYSVALAVTVFLDDHTMVRRSYVNLENDD